MIFVATTNIEIGSLENPHLVLLVLFALFIEENVKHVLYPRICGKCSFQLWREKNATINDHVL